mmetsp:Transcript_11798/g.22753  ORF Transcript_11798/g.22753 Transcript_11798/m.22753 type:complete len:90 (+) Transcript_11798:924-1193(+)
MLFLPFGYWHQVESPPASVAITVRWNPYAEIIRSSTTMRCVALGLGGGSPALPPSVASVLYEQMLKSLPLNVVEVLMQRFMEEKPRAKT